MNLLPGGGILEIKLSVSSGLSYVSVTAIRSPLLSLMNSRKESVLFLIDLMLRRQPLRDLEAVPGLRLISPERARSNDVQGLTFRKLCITLRQ